MSKQVEALSLLRRMSDAELEARVREQRGEVFKVRLQQSVGQVSNHRQLRSLRREVARAMTVASEVRHGIVIEPAAIVARPETEPEAPKRTRRKKVAEAADAAGEQDAVEGKDNG